MITPYSTVWLPVIRSEVRSEIRTIDGASVIQVLGYRYDQTVIYDWIDTDNLQDRVDFLQAMASEGWMLDTDPGRARAQIHPALDLFRVVIAMHRYSPT